MIDFSSISDWLQHQITQNEVFAGIVGGSLFASVLYGLRSVPQLATMAFMRQFTVEMQISNQSEAFEWMTEWLTLQPYTQRARRVNLSCNYQDFGDNGPKWNVSLGLGSHVFRHNGSWVLISYEISEQASRGRELNERYIMRVLGRSQAPLLGIVEEAKSCAMTSGGLPIYIWSGYWQIVARKAPRDLYSVVMPEDSRTCLVRDIDRFINASSWYAERGIPYRRGYLFYGLPGTGKTSIVMALASYFQKPICVLNLASIEGDEALQNAFWRARSDAIVLIEDIDAVQVDREADKSSEGDDQGPQQKQPVSLSGLLNVIDGVAAPDGRILIMTTNHPEKLDAALKRPGRVDMHIEFAALDQTQAVEMFRRFYPESDVTPELGKDMTPAELQGLFLEHHSDPEKAASEMRGES